jgi:hypothetical protein
VETKDKKKERKAQRNSEIVGCTTINISLFLESDLMVTGWPSEIPMLSLICLGIVSLPCVETLMCFSMPKFHSKSIEGSIDAFETFSPSLFCIVH